LAYIDVLSFIYSAFLPHVNKFSSEEIPVSSGEFSIKISASDLTQLRMSSRVPDGSGS